MNEYCVVYISTEDANCSVYGITEARVAFYSKIYERLLFATVVVIVSVPALLEFQASQLATRNIEHFDVGLFHDL